MSNKRESLADKLRKAAQGNHGMDESKQLLDNIAKKDTPHNQSDSQSVGQSVRQSTTQSDNQSNNIPHNQSNNQSVNLSINQSNNQSVNQPNSQSVNTPVSQSVSHSNKIKNYNNTGFTKRQFNVLITLIKNESRIINLKELSNKLQIPFDTIRGIINALMKYGYITHKRRYRHNLFQGIKYELDAEKCKNIGQSIGLSIYQTIGQPDNQSNSQPDNQSISYNSSSSNYTTTTDVEVIDQKILNSNDMGYWKQKGLTTKQIKKWMADFNFSSDLIKSYLCFCAYEMVDLDLENKKNIQKPIDWFFKIIEKTGGYPRPKNYKSYEEKLLEKEREILIEKEKVANEQKEIYDKKIKAEEDKKFWEMMNNPTSDLYKTCYEKINDIAKRKKTGLIFESAMRTAFEKLTME